MADGPPDPGQDKDFLAAAPEDQHAYLMSVDPDYAKAAPADQTKYLSTIRNAQPTQFERDRAKPEGSAIGRMASGAWSAAKSLIPSMPSVSNQPTMAEAEKNFEAPSPVQGLAAEYGRERKAGNPVLSSAAGAVGKVAGIDTEGIQDRARRGDIAGVIGEAVPPIAAILMPHAIGKAADMVPSAERAGQAFNDVKSAAGTQPIDMTKPGNAALEFQRLADAGGSNTKVIRDFLRRATDPTKPPMTYAEARDFYSNASRISFDEANRLTPNMKRQLGEFTRALGDSIEGAAEQVGKSAQYRGAMDEYGAAMRNRDRVDALKGVVKQYGKYAIPGAAAAYTVDKVLRPK